MEIENKDFLRLKTDKTKDIVIALDKSSIPHFARFGDNEISIVFNRNVKDRVDEIVSKATSDDYDYLIREIKENIDDDKCLVLLPEVAKILETTIGDIQREPLEIQKQLCLTYMNLWICVSSTITRELKQITYVEKEYLDEEKSDKTRTDNSDEQRKNIQTGYISRESTRKLAEEIRRKSKDEQRKQNMSEHNYGKEG